jgi:hypothetical protein
MSLDDSCSERATPFPNARRATREDVGWSILRDSAASIQAALNCSAEESQLMLEALRDSGEIDFRITLGRRMFTSPRAQCVESDNGSHALAPLLRLG